MYNPPGILEPLVSVGSGSFCSETRCRCSLSFKGELDAFGSHGSVLHCAGFANVLAVESSSV